MKVFNKSRRQLLTGNRFGRYMLYAFGEIILVVIGILIAVEIGNVKDARERRQEELTHLTNILDDLKKDKVGLVKIIERLKDKRKSAVVMVGYHSGEAIPHVSDYYHHTTNVLYWEAYHPQIISVDELVNSGKLSVIHNEEIKRLLLDIRSHYYDASMIEAHMYNDHTNFLYLRFGNIVDYQEVFKAYFDSTANPKLSRYDIELSLKDKMIKNGFALAGLGYEGLDFSLNEILMKENKVVELIEEEIKR